MPNSSGVSGRIAQGLSMPMHLIGFGAFTSGTAGNIFDAASVANGALSGGSLTFTPNGSAGAGVKSVTTRSAGKYYFEFSWGSGGSTPFLSCGIIGSATGYPSLGYLGPDTNSIGYWKADRIVYTDSDGGFNPGSGTTDGHIYACAVDLTAKLFYIKNVTTAGGWFGSAGSADPAAGTNGRDFSTTGIATWCVAANAGSSKTDPLTINLGGAAFAGTPPSGFTAWG